MSPLDNILLGLILLIIVVKLIAWVHRRPKHNIASVFPIHAQACTFCHRYVGHRGDCPTQDRPTGDVL